MDPIQAGRSQFDMSRDQSFGVQIYTWTKMQARKGKSGVWVYHFSMARIKHLL
jgi:para-nitrobenzyl esterase